MWIIIMQVIVKQVMNYANNINANDKHGWLSGKVRYLAQGGQKFQVSWSRGQVVVLELLLHTGAWSRGEESRNQTMISEFQLKLMKMYLLAFWFLCGYL